MRLLLRVALVLAAAVGAAAASVQPATTCAPRHTTTALSTRPGAQQAMVPPGATSLWLCRYSGLNDGPPRIHLVASRLVTDRAAVADLASRLSALPPASGVYSCPADDGSAIVAEFRYPSGAPNPVTVGLTGCTLATNGHRNALAADPARRLGGLVPLRPPAAVRGHVEVCGGPAPGGCHSETATFCSPGCVTSDRVQALDAAGRTARAVAVQRHGRFSLRLTGGVYTLRLLGDGPHVHGRVMQTRRVQLLAGRAAAVTFMFAVP